MLPKSPEWAMGRRPVLGIGSWRSDVACVGKEVYRGVMPKGGKPCDVVFILRGSDVLQYGAWGAA